MMSDYSGHEEPFPDWDWFAFLIGAIAISGISTCLILIYA